MKFNLKNVLFSVAVFVFAFGLMVSHANAANLVVGALYTDANFDGRIDGVRVQMDEAVLTCPFEGADWGVTTAGSIGITAVTGATCDGSNFIYLAVTASAGVTGGLTDPTLTYTQAAGTPNSVTLTSGNMTNKSFSPTDGAKPVIKSFDYLDADADAMIDSMILTFTETVTAASVLGANDLTFTNVGDFTGAAFGGLVTDLISAPTSTITVPFGTEATAKDTGEGSGSIAISTQNAFTLTDGTSPNTTLGAQTQAVFVDTAMPRTKTFTYQDADGDGKIDRILVTFSEPVVDGSWMSANDLNLTNVGDFTSAAFGTNLSDLLVGTNTSIAVNLGTESTVVDTIDGSGTLAISSKSLFSLLDANNNNNAVLGAQAGTATFVDGAGPVVLTVSPSNTSMSNDRYNPIVVNFSEPMNTASLTFATSPVFTYVQAWSDSNRTVSLSHVNTFNSGVLHTATLSAGSDALSNSIVTLPYSWTFTTVTGSSGTSGTTSVVVSSPSVSVDSGATTVNSSNVTLTLGATNAVSMRISNNPFFTDSGWETYATSKSWSLLPGNGTKTVYVKYTSTSGVESVPVTATVTVSNGASSTTPATPATPATPTNPTTTVENPGCSGGNTYNTSTGAPCVNTAVAVAKVYALGTKTLRNGSTGEAVKELQRFLNDKLNLGLVVDGKLGPKTIAVIKKWQKDNGLVADGLIGPKTKAMMNK